MPPSEDLPAVESSGTIRSRLNRVVLAAFLPLVVLGAWQGILAYRESADLVAARMQANAWSLVDRGRDPFIVARHSLYAVADNAQVREFGAQCGALLSQAGRQTMGTVNLVRTDIEGNVRCSGLPYRAGENFAGTKWWQNARRRGSIVVSDPRIGEISKLPVVIMGLPLQNADGSFAGTLSAGIALEALRGELVPAANQHQGAVLVVNAEGTRIVAAGEPTAIRITNPTAERELQVSRDADGEEWIYVSAPLFEQSIFVVYAEPRREFTARTLLRISLALALPFIAALIAISAIWFGTQRQLLDWFPRLQNLARRIAVGEFTARDPAFRDAPAEIAGLARDLGEMARELEKHERKLQTEMDARLAITREVNHRVRNNLQIVISLLSLQASRSRNRWERNTLEQVRARLAVLALVQRATYEGEGGFEGRTNAATLIDQICQHLRTAYRGTSRIELTCDSENLTMSVDRATPLMLFAVEAISNSFRHAFAPEQSGTITVRLAANDAGEAELTITDDGRGYDMAAIAETMGRELMHAFANQLSGKATFESSQQGVTVRMVFPID